MKSCHIQLGIAPLSSGELEQALAAICKAWLLSVSHEMQLCAGDEGLWLAEKLAAAVWYSIGRFVRITLVLDFSEQQDMALHVLEEADYARILCSFRLGMAGVSR